MQAVESVETNTLLSLLPTEERGKLMNVTGKEQQQLDALSTECISHALTLKGLHS